MFTKWLVETIRECGAPICFLAGLYTFLGLGFLFVSPPVGAVLLVTGLAIAALFLLLSYLTYRREQHLKGIAGRRRRDRRLLALQRRCAPQRASRWRVLHRSDHGRRDQR